MSNPIGIMIQAQGASNRQALIEHCAKANYATVSVLDDFQLCRDIKDRLPDCVVVYRASDYQPTPNQAHAASITAFLNGIQSQDKRIVCMVNCEAGYSSDHVKMWTDMIETAEVLGWKLCVGNMSSGSVLSGQGNDANDWLYAAPLFAVLNRYQGHYLAFHEYSYPYPWSVSNGAYGEPNQPPSQLDWTKPQWHIGRNIQGIQNACKQLGIQPPRCIVTENLIDTMGDIVQHFGYKADGYKTLVAKWNEWYPGKDTGDVLADMHQWTWQTAYKPCGFVIGTHTYCYADASGDAHLWKNYRVDDNPRYLARMEAYNAAPAQPPFDYGTMRHVQLNITSASINTINLRAMPSVDSTILAQLIDGDDLQYSQNGFNSGGYTWFKVISAGITGFVAQTPNFEVIPVSSEPPPADKATVIIRIPGLTLEQAQLLIHNVEISIE